MSGTPTPTRPAPTAYAAMVNYNGYTGACGPADVVIDVTGELVHLLVPIPGLLATFRLTFTPEQLGTLLDELVESSELVL